MQKGKNVFLVVNTIGGMNGLKTVQTYTTFSDDLDTDRIKEDLFGLGEGDYNEDRGDKLEIFLVDLENAVGLDEKVSAVEINIKED